MKAVVFHAIGDVRLEEVADPKIEAPTDAVVRLTASALCGTDLHIIRGTMAGMKKGTILGHEGVGIVEEVGASVRNFKPGDRVVIPSTIACGTCSFCRKGYFAQCEFANPNGPLAGTAFFGGPELSGPFNGLQAEKARIPFASVGMVKLPDAVTDDQAILLSDIFPTAYFGAELAQIEPGCTVAVFGCGPVGQLAIASAIHRGAGRIFAIDAIQTRLEAAQRQGAEIINYEKEDPVMAIREFTRGAGPDCAIDAVGVDANCAHSGPAAKSAREKSSLFEREVKQVAPEAHPKAENWHPGDAPSGALDWAVDCVSKVGTIAIIGVYPETMNFFAIGKAMNKNLTIRTGVCNHRKYIPKLIDLVRTGTLDPSKLLSQELPLDQVIEAYEAFDTRRAGWLKVSLLPQQTVPGYAKHGKEVA